MNNSTAKVEFLQKKERGPKTKFPALKRKKEVGIILINFSYHPRRLIASMITSTASSTEKTPVSMVRL